MEPKNRFQDINSASLCSLAGRYDDPIPTRCLAPLDFLKIPALTEIQFLPPMHLIPPVHILLPQMFTARRDTFPGDCNHDVHKMTHSAESERFGPCGLSPNSKSLHGTEKELVYCIFN